MHVGVPGRVIGAPRVRLQRLDDRFTVQNLRVKLRLEIGIQVAQLGINVVELVACLDQRCLQQSFLDLIVHDYSFVVRDGTLDVARRFATQLRLVLPMQLDLVCVETVCGKLCVLKKYYYLVECISLTLIHPSHLLGCDGYAHRLFKQIEKFSLVAAHKQLDPLRALYEPLLLHVEELVLSFKTGNARVQLSHELVGC